MTFAFGVKLKQYFLYLKKKIKLLWITLSIDESSAVIYKNLFRFVHDWYSSSFKIYACKI